MAITVSALSAQFARIGIDANFLSGSLQQMVASEMNADEDILDLFAKEASRDKFRFGAFRAVLGSKDPLKRCLPLSLNKVLILITSKRLYIIQIKAFLIKENVDKMDFGDIPRPVYYYIKGGDIYFIIQNDRSMVIDWVRGLNINRFKNAMATLDISYWPGR